MSEFDRRLKVKHRKAPGQCSIENAGSIPYEIWDAEYVNLSGFCGPHKPETFAAAPAMLEALREAEKEIERLRPRESALAAHTADILFKIRAAIAAAAGGAG